MSYSNRLLGDDSSSNDASSYLHNDVLHDQNRSGASSGGLQPFVAKLKANKRTVAGVVVFLVLIALIAGIVSSAVKHHSDPDPPPNQDKPWLNVLLPSDRYVPMLYTVDLVIDVPNTRYWGNITMTLAVMQSTDTVLVHTENSTINSVTVAVNGSVVPLTFELYEPNDYLVIHLSQSLTVGADTNVTIQFESVLDESLRGLYRSTYLNDANQSITIATTQFEATDARKAFPCMDEPALKANWSLIITSPQELPTTRSNMPELWNSSVTINNRPFYRTGFDTTPRMSSYLLAIVVSDYKSQCMTFQDTKQFCVWAAPDKVAQAAYAVGIGANQSGAYDQYFGVPFPLPKQDMFAIADFAAGAMENWGLITYRETALLYDETINTATERQSIARVIAHEGAHQWFGDLVTMKWWSDLWLNEGFASWVQYLGMDAVRPDWQGQQQFLTDTAYQAFQLDGLPVPGTHKIVDNTAFTPAQISSLFDSISYNKGACLIREMETILGPETFRTGLQRYLRKHSYSNAASGDLMTELTLASGSQIDFNTIMDTYLNEPGYPLITLHESIDPENHTLTFRVSQQHYLSPPNSPVDTSIQWHVPINFIVVVNDGTAITEQALTWLKPGMDSVALPLTYDYKSDFYIKLNRNQGFYYRVLYPRWMYDEFAYTLNVNCSMFSIEDRTGLIQDTFSLANAGLVPWSAALNLTYYLALGAEGEQSLTPITAIITELDRLLPYFTGDDFELFSSYASSLFSQLYSIYDPSQMGPTCGWCSHVQLILLQRLYAAAARYHVGSAFEYAGEQFKANYQNIGSVMPEIQSTVLAVGMAIDNDPVAWDNLWAKYRASTNAAMSARYLQSLASIQQLPKLNALLTAAITPFADNGIKSQDSGTVMALVATNSWSAFNDFIRNNFDRVCSWFGSGYSGLGRVMSAWVGSIRDQDRLDTLTAFMTDDRQAKLGAGRPLYNAAVLIAQQNIAFKTNMVPAVRDWMNWYINVLSPQSASEVRTGSQ